MVSPHGGRGGYVVRVKSQKGFKKKTGGAGVTRGMGSLQEKYTAWWCHNGVKEKPPSNERPNLLASLL